MSENLHENKSVGRDIKAACAGSCFGITNHKVNSSMDLEGEEFQIDWWVRHQIITCQGCKTISFRKISGCSEDYEQVGQDEWISHESIQLYPPRKADSRGLGDDVKDLPETVAALYLETRTTLINSTPVLAGIGLRAIVETVCKQKGTPKGDLQQRIESLVEMGVLTKSDASILHHIRSMGNQAAHEAKPHGEEQLMVAMEAVENLLKSVYIMPAKLAKFMLPRSEPNSEASPTV